eukprot:scaffold2300_cov116-Skeletonema_dohrnii-CCMP3373.AAC.6
MVVRILILAHTSHNNTMEKGDVHTKEEDSASAAADSALDAAEAGTRDDKELKSERKASEGSSVALDRFQARVQEKLLTSSDTQPVTDERKASEGSRIARGSFQARVQEKMLAGSNTHPIISSTQNHPIALTIDDTSDIPSSSVEVTREDNGTIGIEVLEDDIAPPIPLQMETTSEEDNKIASYQQKMFQTQPPSAAIATASSNTQQQPIISPPPQSILRHDTSNRSSDDLYAVNAELVEDSRRDTSEQSDEEVYEAVVIPTRWYRYNKIIGATLMLLIAALLAVALVYGSLAIVLVIRKRNGNESAIRITSSPTQQPTYNCIVRDDGVLTSECLSCSVAFDRDVGIVAMNHYKRVRFLSQHNQTLEAVSDNCVDFDYGAVALSGNVAVLGVNDGGVHVFERGDTNNTDTWNQTEFLLPDICPQETTYEVCKAKFGFSVDIDGDVMAVGASDVLDDADDGAVYVYRRRKNEKMWVLEQAFLSGAGGMQRFGRVVSVKGDRIAVAYQGAVQLFERIPSFNLWTQVGNPTVSEECGGASDFGFGYSIALVGEDGLLVGCPADNNSVGTVRYYTRDLSTGTYIGKYTKRQIITPFDQSIKYFGGGDTQLKVDGGNVIISTFEKRNGSVFLFTLVDDKWIETARIMAPDGIKNFGGKTALSGGRVIVSSETNVHSYFLDCTI